MNLNRSQRVCHGFLLHALPGKRGKQAAFLRNGPSEDNKFRIEQVYQVPDRDRQVSSYLFLDFDRLTVSTVAGSWSAILNLGRERALIDK